MSTPAFPEPPATIPATSLPDCDAVLARLEEGAKTWVNTSRAERIALLRRAIDGMLAVAHDWVAAASKAKGHRPGSPGAGEEHVAGIAPVIRHLRLFVEALEAGGNPKAPSVTQASARCCSAMPCCSWAAAAWASASA